MEGFLYALKFLLLKNNIIRVSSSVLKPTVISLL
jgi:hypothetical protein